MAVNGNYEILYGNVRCSAPFGRERFLRMTGLWPEGSEGKVDGPYGPEGDGRLQRQVLFASLRGRGKGFRRFIRFRGCGIALRAMSFICRSAANDTGFAFVSLLLHDVVL